VYNIIKTHNNNNKFVRNQNKLQGDRCIQRL